MFQRLTRAKAKVAEAGVPFETPARRHWPERVQAVLATLEVAWSVAYRDAAQGNVAAELAPEVERVALILAELMPQEPEALALAAVIVLARSRENARVDKAGAMVPLSEQDTALWDSDRIRQAYDLFGAATEMEQPGAYQAMAAIHLAHASRLQSGITPWSAIASLYDELAHHRPSAVVGINRALDYGRATSPERGLAELAKLDAGKLDRFLPFHVARSDLLARAGQVEDARAAFDRALELEPGPAETLYLKARRAALAQPQD